MSAEHWTLGEEYFLRQYDNPSNFNQLILSLLGVDAGVMAEGQIESVVSTGAPLNEADDTSIDALPVALIHSLLGRRNLGLPIEYFSFCNKWELHPYFNVYESFDEQSQKGLIHRPVLLSPQVEPPIEDILVHIVNAIAPLPREETRLANLSPSSHAGGARSARDVAKVRVETESHLTILLPKENLKEDIPGRRGQLRWEHYSIDTIKLESSSQRTATLMRLIIALQLLSPDGKKTRESALVRDLLKLTGWNNFLKLGGGFDSLSLSSATLEEIARESGCTEMDRFSAYVGYSRKRSVDQENQIRLNSEKMHPDDPNVSIKDLKQIREALANLICHTGGVAITIRIPNIKGAYDAPLATPTIVTCKNWHEALIALRKRLTKGKRSKQVVESVSQALIAGASESQKPSHNEPVIHLFSDPD